MRRCKVACIFALCIILISLISPAAVAAGPVDMAVPCVLNIDHAHEGMPITGTRFDIYRVASLSDEMDLVFTGAFADMIIDFDDMSDVALQLYCKVVDGALSADMTVATNENGLARAEGLLPGAYLLVGSTTTIDDITYYVDPQLIIFPQADSENGWAYELTVYPKSTDIPVSVEPIDITVDKKWSDEGFEDERPTSIRVRLLREGRTVDTVVLSDKNGWTHTWTGLLPNAQWSVEEDVPEGYVVETLKTDNTFILTNYRKNIDQTGVIWWPVAVLLLSGLVLTGIGISIRRSDRRET